MVFLDLVKNYLEKYPKLNVFNPNYEPIGLTPYGLTSYTNLLMKYVLVYYKYGDEIIDHINDLLLKKPQLLDSCCENGWSPIMLACLYSHSLSHIKIVKLLINKGANLNYVSKNGQNVLTLAACYSKKYSNQETVKLLLNKSMDINYTYKLGCYTHTLITDVIKSISDTTSTIETAIFLIKNGADIHKKLSYKKNALSVAIERYRDHNDIALIKILLKYNSKIYLSEKYFKFCKDNVLQKAFKDDKKRRQTLMYKIYNCISQNQDKFDKNSLNSLNRDIRKEYQYYGIKI